MVIYSMLFASLKRHFLAALPVIGPHADIEAELMLAGKKPLTWFPVFSDENYLEGRRTRKVHADRKVLDEAVTQGQLISLDVEYIDPACPEVINVSRHYAQPDQEKNLMLVANFNREAFSRRDTSNVIIKQDLGIYLGYRRRDILFFNHIATSKLLPHRLQNLLVNLNSSCQVALREKLLLTCGRDPAEWSEHFLSLDDPAPQ